MANRVLCSEQNKNKSAQPRSPRGDEATVRIDRAARIAALNDAFRRSFSSGRVVMSAGFAVLPSVARATLLAAVRGFDCFDAGNDPHGEHDFGAVEVGGRRCFWKIDTYDRALRGHSPDPADPAVTTRVLTVMLAEEY